MEEIKGYVYTVANGLAINKYRKEILRRPAGDVITNVEDIPDETFDLFSATALKMAIETLDEDEKTCFRLKYLHGFTSKEIGEMYQKSPSAVRRKLQIIKRKLIERLGEKDA